MVKAVMVMRETTQMDRRITLLHFHLLTPAAHPLVHPLVQPHGHRHNNNHHLILKVLISFSNILHRHRITNIMNIINNHNINFNINFKGVEFAHPLHPPPPVVAIFIRFPPPKCKRKQEIIRNEDRKKGEVGLLLNFLFLLKFQKCTYVENNSLLLVLFKRSQKIKVLDITKVPSHF